MLVSGDFIKAFTTSSCPILEDICSAVSPVLV